MASELPVDLLEEIFLHLDDAADLARASSACASFRRAVSDDRFLRRFRSRHRRPPVLGLLENSGGGKIRLCPVRSPRRSALAAGACAEAADFTFSFIPIRRRWWVRDARDGRVLLSRYRRVWFSLRHRRPPLLVVCDPLHRRHVEIPAIPGHLLDTEHGGDHQKLEFEPFLVPAQPPADEEVDELSFQVICNALSAKTNKLVAFAFSSASGQWRAAASFSNPSYVLKDLSCWHWSRQPAHGCFYWTDFSENSMLVLDTRCEMMKFFVISDIPHKSNAQHKIVVEAAAGEGRLGLLFLEDNKLELYSRASQGNNGGVVVVPEPTDQEWRHDKTIPIFAGLWNLSGAANGYAFLQWLPRDQFELWTKNPEKMPEAHYFTVDLKTLIVERLCELEFSIGFGHKFLYASFPPPFSAPTV